MKSRALAILVAGIVAAGVASAQETKKEGKKSKAKPVTVKMTEQNGSKETGSAKLTPEGADKTKVVISLKGAPKGTAQPAHIHEGSCANLNPKPKQGLTNVVNGKSTTTVPMSIEQLTGGDLAINVHKSTEDLKTYVSCGDIKK